MYLGVNNSKIERQIDELFSSILIEQHKYNDIKPPNEDQRNTLTNILDQYAKDRGIPFFFPYLSTGRGHGPFTELTDGSVKFDLIGSMGINLLGHAHPLSIRAHLEIATFDSLICGNLLPYEIQASLVNKLLNCVASSPLRHFWFAGSGSQANDIALKIIWQKTSPKTRILAFEKNFAGRTIGSQDITWNPNYREGMPELLSVSYVPHFNHDNPQAAIDLTLMALDREYNKYPEEFSCLMMELIQGEAGFVFGDKTYYHAICNWAKDHNLFILIDEIQSFSRTKQLFAFQTYELDQFVDVVTVGKTLQCCGTFFSSDLNPKPGLMGGTFAAPLVSINFAHKLLDLLQEGNFHGTNGRIADIESKFSNKFKTCAHHLIKNSRCNGTMVSFEIGDSSYELTWKYLKLLFNHGVIAFSAGKNPTRIRFLLPITLTDTHIDRIFDILTTTLNDL